MAAKPKKESATEKDATHETEKVGRDASGDGRALEARRSGNSTFYGTRANGGHAGMQHAQAGSAKPTIAGRPADAPKTGDGFRDATPTGNSAGDPRRAVDRDGSWNFSALSRRPPRSPSRSR